MDYSRENNIHSIKNDKSSFDRSFAQERASQLLSFTSICFLLEASVVLEAVQFQSWTWDFLHN